VDAYPPGTQTTCRVNSEVPGEAVLERRLPWIVFVVFLPLIFVAVGAGGIYGVWRSDGGNGHGAVESISQRARKNRGKTIGPHGSGKTTLLEQLADRLSATKVWVRLNAETDRPALTALEALRHEIGPEHAVLIDGAEQLGPWSWWRVHGRIRHAGTIVITSHQSGRLPTVYECATDPELLRELVEELAPDAVGSVDLEALFYRHHGNIRLCFRELYDVCAK
jgi:ABC-type branched-subunit amino acid transport system ATPase component